MGMQNSFSSSLERRLRVLDELQVGRDASYERCSVIIFAMKCFSVGENVRHDITPLSPCCSWSLSTILDVTDTTTPTPHLNSGVPAPCKRCWGEAAGG